MDPWVCRQLEVGLLLSLCISRVKLSAQIAVLGSGADIWYWHGQIEQIPPKKTNPGGYFQSNVSCYSLLDQL